MSALREAEEVLGRGNGRWLGLSTARWFELHAPEWQTHEDVLQSLPEHLWDAVSVRRVAPGRFVVEFAPCPDLSLSRKEIPTSLDEEPVEVEEEIAGCVYCGGPLRPGEGAVCSACADFPLSREEDF